MTSVAIIATDPWVTASEVGTTVQKVSFPYLAKYFILQNTDGVFGDTGSNTLSFGFTENGVASSSNRFTLAAGDSIELEMRIKALFLSGSSENTNFQLIVGMTTIPQKNMPIITGSDGWEGIG